MTAHAKIFSPSKLSQLLACRSSARAQQGLQDSRSAYATEGQDLHECSAICLVTHTDAAGYIGRIMPGGTEITPERAEIIQKYVDTVREYAEGGELLVEQRVEFSETIGQPNAFGTADAIITHGKSATLIDAKFGAGVAVDADNNSQLMAYGLGMLEMLGDVLQIDTVTLVIVQPRLNSVSEWTISAEQLRAWGEHLREQAKLIIKTFEDDYYYYDSFSPGEAQCRWCKAQATCPALRQHVLTTVADDFVDESKPIKPQIEHAVQRTMDDALLGNLMGCVDLIEDFVKAIRAEAERRLLAGSTVPGWKLVEGRRGARAWTNDADVEEAMKSMRLRQDEMYDFKLISPTKAEKLLKKESPKRWAKLEELITQSEGKPSVAPASDKRPALVVTAVADEFDSLV